MLSLATNTLQNINIDVQYLVSGYIREIEYILDKITFKKIPKNVITLCLAYYNISIGKCNNSLCSYPERNGNSIRVFIGGVEFYTHFQDQCSLARKSIWCGISFVNWKFKLPNGKKWWKYFIELKKKNPFLIIKCLIWRNNNKRWTGRNLINGNQTDLNKILKNKMNKYIEFKWDESPSNTHCHHQKYHIIDNKYGYIGGMNLCGHKWFKFNHDTFIEIKGKSVIDIINNFKLRWNNNNIFNECIASKYCKTTDIININQEKQQINDINDNKDVKVRISWSCHPNLYPNYKNGENSIYQEYFRAFSSATSSIYIENQHMGQYDLLSLIKNKLELNPHFSVIYIVPVWMMNAMKMMNFIKKGKKKCIDEMKKTPFFETFPMLSLLNKYNNFSLCGVYHNNNNWIYGWVPTYVHSKLCIVDGKWFTIGSANIVDISLLYDHTEINASINNKYESMKLLKRLAKIHCNYNVTNENDSQIIKKMIQCARDTNNTRIYSLI